MKKTLLLIAIAVSAVYQQAQAQTWTAQTSGTTERLYQVQFLNANTGFACGDIGTVLTTANGGITWTAVNISTKNPVRDIYFVSTTEGWAAVGDENNSSSSGAIWHTTNGGTSWTSQTPSTTEARLGVYFSNSTTGWAVGSRNGPINIDATTNGGSTWDNQSDNNIFGWLYKIDAPSSITAYAIGGTFFPSVTGFIIKTQNRGTTWVRQSTGTIPFPRGMDFITITSGFVVGDAGMILATTNGGSTWSTQTSGTTDTLQDVSFVSTTNGWACGFSGTIRRTVNSGITWTGETSGTTQNLNGICTLDSVTAWVVGNGGTIKKSTGTTGIANIENPNPNIQVFPNPFTYSATISIGEDIILKDAFLLVYDVSGREVQRISVSTHETVFSKGILSAGLYNYSLVNHNATIGNGQLIIR